MKKIVTILLIMFSLVASAQDCVFKDSIFNSILSTQNINDSRIKVFTYDSILKFSSQIILDTDNNGKISSTEAKNVHELYITDGINNNIKSLDGIACFSEMVTLSLSGLQIDSISIHCAKLTNFHVINNSGLRIIDAANSILDTVIVASNSKLEKLFLKNSNNLNVLDCSYNDKLNIIDVNNCQNISVLSSINSSISQINLITNPLIRNLILKNNKINKILMNYNPSIQTLILDDNPIDSIDISSLNELNTFSSNNTNITTIDASHNFKLKIIDIANNLNLLSVNLKNGSKLNEFYLSNVPKLRYICIDDVNEKSIMDTIKKYGNSKIEVNSFCSDKPGGYSNSIKALLKFDSDGNGCDMKDSVATTYSKFALTNFKNIEYGFVNKLSEVNFYSFGGAYNLKPIIDTNYFSVVPSYINLSFMDSLNRDTIVNFCVKSKNSFKDIEVLILPTNSAIIGDTVTYEILIRNKSSVSTDGSCELIFDDSLVSVVNPSIFNSVSNNKLHADFTELTPFESRKYLLGFKIKSTIQPLKDSISYKATVSANGIDVYPNDNEILYKQPIYDSVKSNFITCLNGNSVLNNNPINYLINFDYKSKTSILNTVIIQLIDTTKFEPNTIQLLQSSVPARISIMDNKILYYIDNKTGEHKHGNILLRYQGFKDNSNDTLFQNADIYFDYNQSPYHTESEISITKKNLVAQIKDLSLDHTIEIFPNPTNSSINVIANSPILSIEIYDINGRTINTILSNDVKKNIDITILNSGIYLLKVITSSGVNVLEIQKD